MLTEHTALLRALSALLVYPDADLQAALPEIDAALRASPALHEAERQALMPLLDALAQDELLDSQMRYVDLFDHGRSTSLNLFEHVYGDSRARGEAMLALRERYAGVGLAQADYQLPDYLPLMLEYLSCSEPDETVALLGECAHVLRRLGAALRHRQSAYAAIIAALLQLAGQAPFEDGPTVVPREDIDREWEERPAFENSHEVIASGDA
ncbi:nitrate reductase molybdenum cofactor assembly chaperone [Castellaniella caeni]|uniref:nitrate reductase molybdenum cofactor assembly chaperone n=1 Tax=Castellaniella caeni TaxID=266123 RepID=UPI0008339497|nr:nitrate reductase molybdenum cofactor assembly chaperone [Castellaniella caeni]